MEEVLRLCGKDFFEQQTADDQHRRNNSVLGVFVDGEGTLGLPESKGLPVLYGHLRFIERCGIGFTYFRVNRVATLLQVNESKNFNLDDLTIIAGADERVTLTNKPDLCKGVILGAR